MMTRAQREAKRRHEEARARERERLAELRQHLTPGQTLVDHRGQAYEVQPDGSIRRVVIQAKEQA